MDKIQVIKDWPQPHNLRDLRGFLGLTRYYRKFVQGYAQLAQPLTEQLKKDKFGWSPAATKALNELKTAMTNPSVLAMPNFEQPFVVETDASGYGSAAVLMQNQRSLGFHSKLLGVQKWVRKLIGFDFVIQFKPGVANKAADALSRAIGSSSTPQRTIGEGWFCEASHNQAMRFGDLPAWATEISTSVKETIQFNDYVSDPVTGADCHKDLETCLFPPNLLSREPFFDQLIVNQYQPGEGICAHVDLMRFEDGIAIVSLESSCVMHFTRAESEATNNRQKVPVYLSPGSLVLMWGEARYLWKHEINRNPGIQTWEGKNIDQKRRTSITLRKLCNTD
ncbi:hypothetical protein AgCh_032999 [Apium graveolens]